MSVQKIILLIADQKAVLLKFIPRERFSLWITQTDTHPYTHTHTHTHKVKFSWILQEPMLNKNNQVQIIGTNAIF